MRLIALCVACVFAFANFTSAQTQPATRSTAQSQKKKLIEFGWDEPDTAFMREHIAEMEKTPFDGTVFHVMYAKPDGTQGHFIWEGWSKRAFAGAEFQHAIEDLKRTKLEKFTHNFLRFNTTPGDVDWFDDFGPIVNNARLMATIAKDGKAAGILFDIEQYNAQLFNYARQRDAKTKSFDQYAAQAMKRGSEVMAAFQEGFPDLHVILTFGHTLPHMQTGGDKSKLAQVEYGLAAPFLDGMFLAARGKSKIVDGFEISYGYKDPKQFDEVPVTIANSVIKFVGDAGQFSRHGSLGFGLWMDYDWRNKAWDERDFSKNHFSPEQFEASVAKALSVADEYVWIYTETPKWWTANGGRPEKLPAEYDRAVRRAAGR